MLVKQALPFWTQNICTFLAENVINCRNIVNYSFLTFHYMHRGLEKKVFGAHSAAIFTYIIMK